MSRFFDFSDEEEDQTPPKPQEKEEVCDENEEGEEEEEEYIPNSQNPAFLFKSINDLIKGKEYDGCIFFLLQLQTIIPQYENPEAFLPELEEIVENLRSSLRTSPSAEPLMTRIEKMIQNLKNSNQEDDNDGWFASSDDEEMEKIKEKATAEDPMVAQRRLQKQEQLRMQKETEKLRENWSKEITEELAEHEIEIARESRESGKIVEPATRILELIEHIENEDLLLKIKTEFCFTLAEFNPTLPISVQLWDAAIDALMEIEDHAKDFYPLLTRLDLDFQIRNADERYAYHPDSAHVTSLQPQFCDIVSVYSKELLESGEHGLGAQLQCMLLKHMYMSPRANIVPFAASVMKIAIDHKDQIGEHLSFELQILPALFVATNAAIRGNSQAASKLLRKIPEISPAYPELQIYYNRALARTAIAAFEAGDYKLAVNSLKTFSDIFDVRRKLGQAPNLFSPSHSIDTREIELVNYLSGMILDLPYLAARFSDENKILVSKELHQNLGREPPAIPDTLLARVNVSVRLAVKGDWCGAADALSSDIQQFFSEYDQWLLDLKKTSLCCFLLNASMYYDSVTVTFLATKFEIAPLQVRLALRTMVGGRAPVQGGCIVLHATLDEREESVSFEKVNKESKPSDYGRVIQQNKIKEMTKLTDEERQERRQAKLKMIEKVERQTEELERRAALKAASKSALQNK